VFVISIKTIIKKNEFFILGLLGRPAIGISEQGGSHAAWN